MKFFTTVEHGYMVPSGYGIYYNDYPRYCKRACWMPFNIPLRLLIIIYHWSLFPFRKSTWLETELDTRVNRELRRLLYLAYEEGIQEAMKNDNEQRPNPTERS